MVLRICVSVPVLLALIAPLCAHAQGEPSGAESGAPPGLVDSVVAGVFAHEVASDEEDGIDANLELRLRPLFGKTWRVEVLPTIGGTLNDSGGTNAAYAGATARYCLTDSVYVEGFFGLTVHDADTPIDAEGLDLGCSVLFREGAGIGYRAGRRTLSLYVSHASHGDILCNSTRNDGMTSIGVRYGVEF